jgi:hypothetical protein
MDGAKKHEREENMTVLKDSNQAKWAWVFFLLACIGATLFFQGLNRVGLILLTVLTFNLIAMSRELVPYYPPPTLDELDLLMMDLDVKKKDDDDKVSEVNTETNAKVDGLELA